jgi:hypothetical protein
VICVLGTPSPRRASTLLRNGTANLVAAMQDAGVRRLVCVTWCTAVRWDETQGDPEQWGVLRRRWDRLHTARIALDTTGFALITAAAIPPTVPARGR